MGAPVYITWSWLLFVVVIVPLYTRRLSGWMSDAAAIGVSAALALMWGLSVLLHELGHVMAARWRGCEVERVEIGFLGGATTVRGDDDSPRDELIVAAAGPAVSLLLGLPGAIGMLAGSGASLGLDGVAGLFVSALTIANLAIAAFNLLPGLPLDGGRVALAVLWSRTGDRRRATVLASYGGQLIAAALAGYALWRVVRSAAPMTELPWVAALMIMSASLWSMAARSRSQARYEQSLAAQPLSDRLVHVDVLEGDLPAAALRSAATPLVLVRTAEGVGYADRALARADGYVADYSVPLPEHRLLPETASRLDLLEAMREHEAPWFVVLAADGTVLGLAGARAASR